MRNYEYGELICLFVKITLANMENPNIFDILKRSITENSQSDIEHLIKCAYIIGRIDATQ